MPGSSAKVAISRTDEGSGGDLRLQLIAAGVPEAHVARIMKGQYTAWDDLTVALEKACPGHGPEAREFLRGIYEHLLSPKTKRPISEERASVAFSDGIALAYAPLSVGPMPQSRHVQIVSASDFEEVSRRIAYLGSNIATSSLDVVSQAFPWFPVINELKRNGRHDFCMYSPSIKNEALRIALWRSLTETMRALWAVRYHGGRCRPDIESPENLYQLWLVPGYLPAGFIDRTFYAVRL
jgi:hypothetical protein